MSVLLLPAADEEYLPALAAFTDAHPEVEVVIVGYPGAGGTWQAIITERDGETIVVRYSPRALLGKLGALMGDR